MFQQTENGGYVIATVITRNPFARACLVRMSFSDFQIVGQTCDWCGGRNRRGGLFRYGYELDERNGYPTWRDGLFCSKSCAEMYNGGPLI